MTAADLEALRAAGLSDPAILDVVEAIAYFNYINRVADGLGVDLEPEWRAEGASTGSPAPRSVDNSGQQ